MRYLGGPETRVGQSFRHDAEALWQCVSVADAVV